MRLAVALAGLVNLVAAQPIIRDDGSAALEFDLSRRIDIPNECQNTYSALQSAVDACFSLASAAATDARNGSASRMIKFFKYEDTTTREAVARGFDSIAQECISNSGSANFRCVDLTGQCSGTDYYGYRTGNSIVLCDSFYKYPVSNTQCNINTQAVNLVHEISHLPHTVESEDFNACYGIDCIERLSPQQNLKHADTYALFAQAVHSSCY